MSDNFSNLGFLHIKQMFEDRELRAVHQILRKFHRGWLQDNLEFFQQRAVNSAYITGTRYLNYEDRRLLFNFIGSQKLTDVLKRVIPEPSTFVNTQLFFDPANPDQNNYWHRDIQYNQMTIPHQKEALKTTNALHFRIPLETERGIELVPGTHRRWDTPEEFEIRLEQNGRHNYEVLSTGQSIPLERGDLLVFSGNMIHRGLYGQNRFAFDILFGDASPQFTRHIKDDNLPDEEILKSIDNPACFLNAIRSKIKGDD